MPQSDGKGREALSARSRIYRFLYESKEFCSRQVLAGSCGVSMPTLYQNLSDLMEDGLVRYTGEDQFTGGRRAQGLDIVPDARISIGVSVTEHNLRIVAADLRLHELAYRSLPVELISRVSDAASLSRTVEDFIDEFSLDRRKLLGVGVAIPGLLTADHTRLLVAPTLGLHDISLDDLIRSLPYPVRVENDGSASGHAECFVRGGRRNMAYLSLENGVGGAVLMNGELYAGDNSRSGEFGHICVEPGGLPCSCGRSGCLEAYCSALRIEQRFGVPLEDFFRGVEAHRPEYEALLYDMLRHLAVGINSIRMTLDCEVVIGGFLSEYLHPYLGVLRSYVQALDAFSKNADYVQLSRLPRHITPLGAALYFIRAFIESV
ncbi:MAG: ROK family protein [Oscillospiraceae bacterium]|nr:ROK family protein [Oscillospiraceae bacterium]